MKESLLLPFSFFFLHVKRKREKWGGDKREGKKRPDRKTWNPTGSTSNRFAPHFSTPVPSPSPISICKYVREAGWGGKPLIEVGGLVRWGGGLVNPRYYYLLRGYIAHVFLSLFFNILPSLEPRTNLPFPSPYPISEYWGLLLRSPPTHNYV